MQPGYLRCERPIRRGAPTAPLAGKRADLEIRSY
jgi:hypothetical protein